MAASKKKAAVKYARAKVTVNVHSTAVSEGAAAKRKLAAGTVKLKGKNGLVISVERLSKHLVRDQRARMVSSMGCVSNPGGPSC